MCPQTSCLQSIVPTCGVPENESISWLPPAIQAYLDHVHAGTSIRAIARARGCHASTVLRQVRKVEALRDDPLKDEALDAILNTRLPQDYAPTELNAMPPAKQKSPLLSDEVVEKEARRILRRLCETHAFLLVSSDMEKSAVFRETVKGRKTRTAVMDREVAQAFALRDWIAGSKKGRVAMYQITAAGKSALKRLIAEDRLRRTEPSGYAGDADPFQEQHREFGERTVIEASGARKVRFNLAESPLTALGRKKNKNGTPYLTSDQVDAGERLREDFEIAQLGPRTTQNWDGFLTAASKGGFEPSGGPGYGPSAARDRVAKAMRALGPGLADIAFRCCCFLEGLETAEARLGWSARSGKIVLAIALGRLADHYAASTDQRMVG